MRGRGILHESELSLISDFLQFIVVERVSPEQLALGPNQAFASDRASKRPSRLWAIRGNVGERTFPKLLRRFASRKDDVAPFHPFG
jgi:hypothetical protein